MTVPQQQDARRPYVNDSDFTLYVGDVRDVLRELPSESVHCVVTSPPYWGLRDYGAEGQLGLESTPEEYVANMVEVFREVRRVLRSDGTVWCNLGDSYASDPNKGGSGTPNGRNNRGEEYARGKRIDRGSGRWGGGNAYAPTLKAKDLCGIPWRVAFALQADGWYLRSDIIWSKPNPMPESVTDRPTKAHEYVFLLTKSPRYFFDQEAVREGYKYDGRKVTHVEGGDGSIQHRNGERWPGIGKASHGARGALIAHGHDESEPMEISHAGRNIRSVWEIATQPYPEAHFATFPQALVEPCIKAGTSERGCCPECGALWVRVTSTDFVQHRKGGKWQERQQDERGSARSPAFSRNGTGHKETHTIDWMPTCECALSEGEAFREGHTRIDPTSPSESAPCVVLDPFLGSGTTALVARRLGRKCVGIELSPEYAALAAKRLSQLSLLAETP